MNEKPHHQHKWMPVMYCVFFGLFKATAEKHGYALAIHGSFARDMDLILVPWVENPDPVLSVLKEWNEIIGDLPGDVPYTSRGEKPHGRIAYTIPTGAGGYVDVSVMNGIEGAPTNIARGAICPHAKVLYTTCKCEKSGIEAHGKNCDGKGIYTVMGNLCYEYQYPCGVAEGQTAPVA
jgi:hypothetical protein